MPIAARSAPMTPIQSALGARRSLSPLVAGGRAVRSAATGPLTSIRMDLVLATRYPAGGCGSK
jgi:hypothetical protein